ncbi:Hypothetical predicted protein, partial [Paramuricea clavata]
MFQNCHIKTCMAKGEVKGWHIKGGVLHVMWTCENGHADDWTLSKVLCEKRGQKVFVNTLLMAASILITGNNFEKVRTLFTFLGTGFLSASTFHRIQRNYVVPEVSSLWEEMKKEIWAVLNNETLILCGDGRSDSPGFSAKYGTYVLMEQFLEVIVDLEVIDKRQTGGVSTNMEVAALKTLLERLVGNLVVSEVTDASTAVMALVRRMKVKKHPDHFSHLFHALDIWHKTIKLTKKLAKAAKVKGCESVAEWSEPIRNHFWHIAEHCNGDAEVLKRAHPHQLSKFNELCSQSRKRKACNQVSQGNSSKQPKVYDMLTTPANANMVSQAKIDDLLIGFITEGLMPFSTVEMPSFQRLVKGLQPNRSVMCRATVTKRINEKASLVKKNVKDAMAKVQQVATTTD